MQDALRQLQKDLAGEVRSDPFSRLQYSVDASIFQIEPVAVVLPRTPADVRAAVAFAKQQGLAIIPRGAGTGITGGCLGPGLVLDLAHYQRQILEIDGEREFAVVEPGVVQDQLNAAVAARGLRFGPDTSTGNRATVGGMFGNNSSGAHSMRYGKTSDNVLAVDFLLGSGEQLQLGELSLDELRGHAAAGGPLGVVCAKALDLRTRLGDLVRERYPKIQRNVTGYALDALLGDRVNLARLVCGSEGTLGVATRLKVKLSRSPGAVGVTVLHFQDVIEGLRHVPFILGHQPFALELIDDHIIAMGRQNLGMSERLGWLDGHPGGLLVAEFDGENRAEVVAKLDRFEADCARQQIGYSRVRLLEAGAIADVWELRKAGLGLLLARREPEKAIAFLEDCAVPPEHLADFLAEFRDYLRARGREAGFYGHAGVGLIDVRPMLNLNRQDDLDLMVRMMEDVADLVQRHGGALSGEHGDGLIRSWLIERMYGPEISQGFRELKQAFDPANRMNPGKIVDAPLPRDSLRFGPATRPVELQTMFDFGPHGLAFATAMCNGNAECRKLTGLMCPSFQVTGDEFHSTRARATCLQAVCHGRLPLTELTGEDMYRVMELCLQCKGCRVDCPSQVDVAKMKSEFLYHYHRVHGTPLRNLMFGYVDTLSRLAAPVAGLANWMMGLGLSRALLKGIGITDRRPLPQFARQRFSSWLRRRGGPKAGQGEKVALFVDTFTEFNYPEIGQAAIRLLEALGCDVAMAPYACCGRPAISKGLLAQAKAKARRVQAIYGPLAAAGYRIVGLEPSCILTFRDEHPTLAPGPVADRLAAAALTFDEFLFGYVRAGKFDLPFKTTPAKVLLHGHCHQKAQVGTRPTLAVLRAVPGFDVTEIPSGCCGMAGTFGYEAEHYDISLQIGEMKLFPAIRQSPPETIIVASGLSCRGQIEHGTQRPARHLVEVLAARLDAPA